LAIAGIVLSATNLLWCIVLGVINAATSPSNFSMKFN